MPEPADSVRYRWNSFGVISTPCVFHTVLLKTSRLAGCWFPFFVVFLLLAPKSLEIPASMLA